MALEQRVKNSATDSSGEADPALLGRLRKRVTFERFLARIQETAKGLWVLKGAFALELRLGNRTRTTKDIDVDWKLVEEEAVDLLLEAVATDLGDHFVFRIERAALPPDVGGRGQRWRVIASVAGREFERVLIDVGFECEPVLDPVELPLPGALEFADLSSPRVPALSLEQHLAEKVHAYTRTYGPDDEPSSRVKDLIDIGLVAVSLSVDAGQLGSALGAIFEERATHPLPQALPAPPADWGRAWARLSKDLPIPDEAAGGHAIAARLIDPILVNERPEGTWDPGRESWNP